jgi:hypothetical protein
MKRSFGIIVIAVLALIIVASAEAEQFNPNLMGYGGKVGFSIANVSNHPDHPDNHTGYLIGGLCNYPMTPLISFQMEILISGKGYTITNTPVYDTADNLLGTADATTILQYVEIPVLAKLTAVTTGKYRPYVIGGGFAAFLVRSKLRMDDGLYQLDYKLSNTNDLDVGGIGGVGIDLKAGQGWLFFEARYEQGVISVIKDSNYKSRALSFQAGYWF